MKNREVNWKSDSDKINNTLDNSIFNSSTWKSVNSSNDKFEGFLSEENRDTCKGGKRVIPSKDDKQIIDKEKVESKLRNLTEDEIKMILDDKQNRAVKSAESRDRAVKNTLTFANITLGVFANVIGVILVGAYYVGMGFAFCLLPMPVYDYIRVDNGIDSFGVANNGRKYNKRERLSKSYSNRDAFGKIMLVLVFVAKVACWLLLIKYMNKHLGDNSRYGLISVACFMIYSLLPFHKVGTGMLKKWKEHKEKSANKEEKKREVKEYTARDITKKDIIKYFHDEVTVGDNILETHVVGVDSGDMVDGDTLVGDSDESLADVVQSSINNQ